MKSVQEMTIEELLEESLDLNKRISRNKSVSARERFIAKMKLKEHRMLLDKIRLSISQS